MRKSYSITNGKSHPLFYSFWILPLLTVVTLLAPENPAVKFVDVTPQSGITFKHDNAASPEKYFLGFISGSARICKQ